MKNQITIREAITEADIAVFWGQLHTYHMRDIFPDPEDENRKHFLDDTEYRAQIQRVHDRQQDRCYYLFFHRNGIYAIIKQGQKRSKYKTERVVFYENETCMEGSRFLTLRIIFWRKQHEKPDHHP